MAIVQKALRYDFAVLQFVCFLRKRQASKQTDLCLKFRVSLAFLAPRPCFRGLWRHLGKNDYWYDAIPLVLCVRRREVVDIVGM